MNKDSKKNIGYLVRETSEKVETWGNNVLKQYGLTFAQSRVLAFLSQQGGRASQKEIVRGIGVAHPTVVGIVARLERDGFVFCWQDLADRRVKNVELTEKAKKVIKTLQKSLLQDDKTFSSAFTEEEKQELIALLMRLNAHLDRESIRKARTLSAGYRRAGEGAV